MTRFSSFTEQFVKDARKAGLGEKWPLVASDHHCNLAMCFDCFLVKVTRTRELVPRLKDEPMFSWILALDSNSSTFCFGSALGQDIVKFWYWSFLTIYGLGLTEIVDRFALAVVQDNNSSIKHLANEGLNRQISEGLKPYDGQFQRLFNHVSHDVIRLCSQPLFSLENGRASTVHFRSTLLNNLERLLCLSIGKCKSDDSLHEAFASAKLNFPFT